MLDSTYTVRETATRCPMESSPVTMTVTPDPSDADRSTDCEMEPVPVATTFHSTVAVSDLHPAGSSSVQVATMFVFGRATAPSRGADTSTVGALSNTTGTATFVVFPSTSRAVTTRETGPRGCPAREMVPSHAGHASGLLHGWTPSVIGIVVPPADAVTEASW